MENIAPIFRTEIVVPCDYKHDLYRWPHRIISICRYYLMKVYLASSSMKISDVVGARKNSWLFNFISWYSTQSYRDIYSVDMCTRWYHLNENHIRKKRQIREGKFGGFFVVLWVVIKVSPPTRIALLHTDTQLISNEFYTDSPYEKVQKKIMMCQECSNPFRKENSRSSRSQHGSSSELDA